MLISVIQSPSDFGLLLFVLIASNTHEREDLTDLLLVALTLSSMPAAESLWASVALFEDADAPLPFILKELALLPRRPSMAPCEHSRANLAALPSQQVPCPCSALSVLHEHHAKGYSQDICCTCSAAWPGRDAQSV